MIRFETALAKKRPEYEPVGLLEKDKHFAYVFQFDKLRKVIEGYNENLVDKLIYSTAWIAKNILRYVNKADQLGVSTLWQIANNEYWISNRGFTRPEKFIKEFEMPRKSFYRQRKKFEDFISCKLPGQPKGGFIGLDPPTILDIF